MQFSGKQGIALFVLISSGTCAVGFAGGFLVGRQVPAHHFEKMENSHYLYDTSTGHVCDFVPKTEVLGANGQPDQLQTYLDSIKTGANAPIPPCNR